MTKSQSRFVVTCAWWIALHMPITGAIFAKVVASVFLTGLTLSYVFLIWKGDE